ncbi:MULTISPECIES: hypothetical protein [Pseudomonas]|uniref:Uncharacterized protein n=1 Tax=Pseudomonas lactis TaxID=1615674 RepID=A0ABS9FNM3_9PSED|nr:MULTISPECIES: hypothetical protein [Pseudomonas]MBI6975121.1 hypothetical protein [Pseudomonas lactis]MCF4974149.1 hypothetical protein [Pseudomonas lactis]MCF5003934.1 hypothetical protein [Pseudomonas lactis]MCF5009231.1 hypothetical protein [Pseudomonas lactis]MCF5014694.1 hypothetical protein [Pseudomonas lactis]
MSHNFKPGDLALIVKGPCVGCCVDLISFHAANTDVLLASGSFGSSDVAAWRVSGNGLTARFGTSAERRPVKDGLIPSGHLMPLRGDFTPEQQTAKEAV